MRLPGHVTNRGPAMETADALVVEAIVRAAQCARALTGRDAQRRMAPR